LVLENTGTHWFEIFGIESNDRIVRKQLFGMDVDGRNCGAI
jgi:hypothetical protein